MTKEERAYFRKLSKDRSQSADVLEKPSLRGTKDSVVEKYSDQAHFIYELLQNADDAGADRARFILEEDRLIFAHNGDKYFSVSNPETEEEDSAAGRLGHVNAITSIANSNKSGVSIGKFGVGFKAVFQYTTTPRIYDPQIRFQIERFIVPFLLDKDFPGRKRNETLFVFPFNHPGRLPEEAYDDISEKLRSLVYPILFLQKLASITYTIGAETGSYEKKTLEKLQWPSMEVENLCLISTFADQRKEEHLWLFSRRDEQDLRCCVGFFAGKAHKLIPLQESAFCFFPTKEATGLGFIIHAPFLLTDSREGIRAGVRHNLHMIQFLAELAADALVCLRDIGQEKQLRLLDDGILSIIPTDPSAFTPVEDRRRISFLPFYTEIKKKFKTAAILPTADGYCSARLAYWAEVPQLTKLFSDKQLSEICAVRTAHWVFRSRGRSQFMHQQNKALVSYLEDITCTSLDENAILKGKDYFSISDGQRESVRIPGITEAFIQKQTFEWLNTFYMWLSETDNRTELIRTRPIFLDQDKKPAAAYDRSKHPILFLPDPDMTGYTTIHPRFLQYNSAKKLLDKLKITKPALKDQIYNIILPQYDRKIPEDTNPHFLLFYKFYRSCSREEQDRLISLIQPYPFLQYYTAAEPSLHHARADQIYLPTKELITYFEPKKDTKFLNLENYKALLGRSSEKYLRQFLTDLGVRQEPGILSRMIPEGEALWRELPRRPEGKKESWKEHYIDGSEELLNTIAARKDKRRSLLMWEMLLHLAEQHKDLENRLQGQYVYFYRKLSYLTFPGENLRALVQIPWMYAKDGTFAAPSEIRMADLHEKYDLTGVYAASLCRLLKITDKNRYEEEDKNLNDRQKKQIALAQKLEELGLSASDLDAFAVWKQQQPRCLEEQHPAFDRKEKEEPAPVEEAVLKLPKRMDKTTTNVLRDIVKKTRKNLRQDTATAPADPDADELENIPDADDYLPQSVDFEKKIEQEKRKSAAAIDRIAQIEELQKKADSAKKYSFAWFKALLELEILGNPAGENDSHEVRLCFGKIEREEGTARTLLLRQPASAIPPFMEELSDLPMYLQTQDGVKKMLIESIHVRSYTLRVKLKNTEEIENFDFSEVRETVIEAKSPVFLLEALRDRFKELKLKDSQDLQASLPKNLKFIFGPPGTGKTTYLAQNVLVPFMEQAKDLKILVLTPTNKAADVLTERIMDVMGKDHSYLSWIVRFGSTNEERIEKEGLYKSREYDIRNAKRSVVITTAARFPYDFFMTKEDRYYLHEINWDVIVFDEASMISLAYMVYPLYKRKPKQFIIAGDPFQIEPITTVEQWKDENIYKMVHLDSFAQPQTIPHPYPVELLSTQYRCLPKIGEVFSRFTYGGILQHHRDALEEKLPAFSTEHGFGALNLLKFPIRKYESIYRAKRLKHSSCYQIYSALFTFEFVCAMASKITRAETRGIYRIGIIAPYRVQADLIEKLVSAAALPKHIRVLTGTVHSFQGDECETILAVFNPPPYISPSPNMFLNKRNILNVAISRARDQLFILMPDEQTGQIENLRLINQIEQLCLSNGGKLFHTPDLEENLFGSRTYLEDNTFTTGHQNVNVYSVPETSYEVRSEETAIDLQIHKSRKRR